jgi:DNA-binding NtrC family response regulator
MTSRILVVEDSPELRRSFERHLRARGFTTVGADSLGAAREALADGSTFDAVLLDLGLPGGNGLGLFEGLPRGILRPPVVVMTGDGTVETAVGALRVGVVDYLLKPFSLEALDAALGRVAAAGRAGGPRGREPDLDAARAWRDRHAPALLGESAQLLTALDVLRRVAQTDCSVLVHGETGTGKELVARALHAASARSSGPFVAVNCAAIPDNLIESELFGHSRGAYTGAVRERAGRFVSASGGTLVLDEIAEMPLGVQAKLLRALQEREVVPLGDDRPVAVDVRVIAATHQSLAKLAAERRFREDLLYRLDVIGVELPPLRARIGDIPLLVRALTEDANRRRGTRVTGVSPDALDLLSAYAWPGNVRQLANVMERMTLLRGEGAITVGDLPPAIQHATAPDSAGALTLREGGLDLRATLEELESSLLRQALARARGNKNRAAALLRLHRTTFLEKLKKRGLGEVVAADGEPVGAPTDGE